jgi:ABC-2 type transport system permease protein
MPEDAAMWALTQARRTRRLNPGVYFRVAVKSFQKHLAYRAANIAGIATNVFFGAIYVLIYTALFQGRDQVSGYDVTDAVTYAVVAQSLLMAMSAFGNRDLSEAIIKGDIVIDLSRPLDFYFYWASLDIGRAVYYLIFRGIPTYVIGVLLFGARFPSHLATWLWFLLALAFGIILSFVFRFVVSSLAFWTHDARGVVTLSSTAILFLAGFIVPIAFFPGPLAAIARLLPFQGLSQMPIDIYLGKLEGAALARTLGLQCVWLVLLVLLGRWVVGRLVGRLTVSGG